MKAIIVTRFSDEKQRGGTSTEVQEKTCRHYCLDKDYEVIGIKKFEAESGKITNTKRVKILLDFCRKYEGKTNVLCVYKLDRFARDMDLYIYLRAELLKMNILLHSATEPINSTPAGKLTEHMLAAIAQFDNDQKSERVTLAMRSKLEHGIWPWKVPLAYLNTRTEQGKADIAKIDNESAHHIRNVFDWYTSGKMSITEISQAMQGTGLINKKGKYKGKPIKFSPQTIHNILTNKFYVGILEVKKWNEQFDGDHKPLISVKTWKSCQSRLYPPKKSKMTKRQINPDFPIKDNLMCGYCTRKMTAAWSQGKLKKYAYYYCTHSDCSNPGKKAIGKANFENEFMSYLNMLKPSTELQETINRSLLSRYKKRKDEFETDASRQRMMLEKLEKQKDNLVIAIAEGVDKDDILPTIAKIKEEISLVKLAINESHTGEFKMELLLTYGEKFFSRISLLWHDAPTRQKVQMQRVLFPNGIVYSYEDGFLNTKLRPYMNLILEKESSDSTNVTPNGDISNFLHSVLDDIVSLFDLFAPSQRQLGLLISH